MKTLSNLTLVQWGAYKVSSTLIALGCIEFIHKRFIGLSVSRNCVLNRNFVLRLSEQLAEAGT